MQDSPFAKMVELMRTEAAGQVPAVFRFGTVIQVDPLQVLVNGTMQTKADMYVNPDVELAEGDRVFLAACMDGHEPDQKFVLLCKVV